MIKTRKILSSQLPATIRVVLVEDDANFQNALLDAIQSEDDMQLVAIAGSCAQGLLLLDLVQFDVLLVDLGLPDGSGIEVIRVAYQKWPERNIMVCTTFGDELHVMQSLEAGASGYLLKDSTPAKMVSEIRSLHSGGSPISPLIARQILTRFRQPVVPAASNAAMLSAREKQVLEYITRGFTANEIAELMALSRHTVLTFIRRIYSKLKVNSKSEAIFEARQQNLLDD